MLLLLSTTATPIHSIRIIHSTSRWLRGRSSDTFWYSVTDSREWDEDDERRGQVDGYIPGKWSASRYTLPLEIRVRLGIAWLRGRNFDEALVSSLNSDLGGWTNGLETICSVGGAGRGEVL